MKKSTYVWIQIIQTHGHSKDSCIRRQISFEEKLGISWTVFLFKGREKVLIKTVSCWCLSFSLQLLWWYFKYHNYFTICISIAYSVFLQLVAIGCISGLLVITFISSNCLCSASPTPGTFMLCTS